MSGRDQELREYAAAQQHPLVTIETPDVPLGARKLGCRNCRTGDRFRYPELGLVYCASCPVNARLRALGKRERV